MREILFRGKTSENRWVEGTYFKHDTVKVCFSSDDPKPRHLIIQDGFCGWGFEPPIHCVDVAPNTVGQYTGLTDKNGKKIFEGDILSTENGTFENTGMGHILLYKGMWTCFYGQDAIGRDCFDTLCMVCNSREIIGNIHDNPELLNQ